VLRDIGHQLLLHAKDSTSRVLPVKKINDNTYQISFQNNFVFIPDTLINLVHRQLEKYHLPREYMVSVQDCQQKETIFVYEVSAKTGNLIPCTGREQETGCYLIQIEFLKTKQIDFSWLLLLLIPLCFIGYYLKAKFRKKEKNEQPIDKDFIIFGKFRFYAAKDILSFENKTIKLSEKETKAVKIFAENLNQVIEREKLMKEIWEDEGLVVISRNVDVLISKLRKKLSEDNSIKIINIHGRGYKFMIG
jgi:DNA-binding winged helix-turn-helix (wHTH) protein